MKELDSLYKNGLIDTFYDEETIKSGMPSEQSKDCFIALTEKGGACWESRFEPAWESYLSIEEKYNENGELNIRVGCSSEDLIEKILLPILKERHFEISLMRPWSATYWKLLDIGYVASLRVPDNTFDDKYFVQHLGVWRRNWDFSSNDLKLK
ncbi:hypothetical protein [Hahella sp. CCB-MM4]|uniref:hypothetical protein n=1 Tax=Hahella sp. (strain CCB-MM4) TaxID=1926491 RepID=UPI00143DDE35|nr:hypothetical protein [Hahella sp. CCB-MM4]